jgi:transcriptional regulator with XRE-family HTH domain
LEQRHCSHIGAINQMLFSEKLKLIRKEEKMTQENFAETLGISRGTLAKYEAGIIEPSLINIQKITQHQKYEKYTLWLMTGKTYPEVGQICPTFSTQDTQEQLQQKENKA